MQHVGIDEGVLPLLEQTGFAPRAAIDLAAADAAQLDFRMPMPVDDAVAGQPEGAVVRFQWEGGYTVGLCFAQIVGHIDGILHKRPPCNTKL